MLQAPSRRRLTWVIATLTIAALPAATFAAVSPMATKALSSELPAGVTLNKATLNQTSGALHEAVVKDHKMAAKLVEAAIKAKSTKYTLECAQVRALVKSAASAAPEQARSITEMAVALRPDCADGLNGDLSTAPARGNGIVGEVGSAPSQEAQGFGAGLGAGFPGSPGFIGSAPSGAFAGFGGVTTPAVTSTTNN